MQKSNSMQNTSYDSELLTISFKNFDFSKFAQHFFSIHLFKGVCNTQKNCHTISTKSKKREINKKTVHLNVV